MAFVGSISSNPDKEFDFEKFAAAANKFITYEGSVLKDANGQIYGGADGEHVFRT